EDEDSNLNDSKAKDDTSDSVKAENTESADKSTNSESKESENGKDEKNSSAKDLLNKLIASVMSIEDNPPSYDSVLAANKLVESKPPLRKYSLNVGYKTDSLLINIENPGKYPRYVRVFLLNREFPAHVNLIENDSGKILEREIHETNDGSESKVSEITKINFTSDSLKLLKEIYSRYSFGDIWDIRQGTDVFRVTTKIGDIGEWANNLMMC
ncbi:hypothetical protein FF38_04470, partial [Lucilia cuprina]